MPRQAITSSCYQHSRHSFPDESCSLSNHHLGCQLHLYPALSGLAWCEVVISLSFCSSASSGAIKDPASDMGGGTLCGDCCLERECKLWWLRCKYLWFVTWAACKHKHSHQWGQAVSPPLTLGTCTASARRGDSAEISSQNGILCPSLTKLE